MARNGSLTTGATRIVSGHASLQVPQYITVKTGKYSTDPEKVQIIKRWGNHEDDLGLFPWVKMHGVRITYVLNDAHKMGRVHDDGTVMFQATGEWSVTVESPPGQ